VISDAFKKLGLLIKAISVLCLLTLKPWYWHL